MSKHNWVIIDETEETKTEAMTAGYGALVRDTVYAKVAVNVPRRLVNSTTTTYVPNVKVQPVIPESMAIDEKPSDLYELVPYYPGRNE